MSRPDPAAPEWTARRERSHPLIIRLMVWLSLRLGRPFGRLILHGIAAYFLAFAPAARRASRHYLRRVLDRAPRLSDLYRHFFAFSSTLHDRIYLLNNRFELFDIEIAGEQEVMALAGERGGAIVIGAHLGSFEVLRALGRTRPQLSIAVVMYQDNARKFNDILAAINPGATQDIIPLAQLDSMLQVKDRLDRGSIVGVLGDRAPNSEGRVIRPFLGAPAALPSGAFRMAALLRQPVFFMAGLYLGGNTYRIQFEPLADFSTVDRGGRARAIDAALDAYVGCLERYCRQAPYNWFNFFDFWAMPPGQTPSSPSTSSAPASKAAHA